MNFFIFFVSFFFIAACNSNTPSHSENHFTEKNDKLHSVDKIHSVEANTQQQVSTSPGKQTAGLNMTYKILDTPQVGQAVGVSVFLGTKDGAKSIKAKISSSKKMSTSSSNSLKFSAKSSAETDSQVITVTPMNEGIHYIYINAVSGEGASRRTQAFAIPIEVGNVDWEKELAPEGEIKSDGRGGKVISLPAQ